jgi:hypothetical protein
MAQAGPPIICCCDPNSLEIADPAAVCGKSKFSLAASREELFKPTARLSAKERGGRVSLSYSATRGPVQVPTTFETIGRSGKPKWRVTCHVTAMLFLSVVLSCPVSVLAIHTNGPRN